MAKIISPKVDYSTNPIGIENKRPCFMWNYALENDLKQLSYRIIVTSNPVPLYTSEIVMWDSGKVESDASLGVMYEGAELERGKRYYWKVITETTKGNAESELSFFEMSLDQSEWQPYWLSCPFVNDGSAICFRRNIVIPKEFADLKIILAEAYIANIGCHELYVNGKRIGDAFMNPVISDYDKVVYYNSYDITDAIVNGNNGIGILAGNGWSGQPRFMAIIKVFFENGKIYEIKTNNEERKWTAREAPIVHNSIFNGETYDAHREETVEGWSEYGTRFLLHNGWYFTKTNEMLPTTCIRPQRIEEILAIDELKGFEVGRIGSSIIYDFGKVFTGREVVTVNSRSCSKITMECAEVLNTEGDIDKGSLRNARNTDVFISVGECTRTYMPHFAYRDFRYMKVTVEGDMVVLSVKAQVLKTAAKKTGSFECSDDFLNDLHRLSVNTEACNQIGILSDCQQRDERMGWLNDLTSRIYATSNNFDMLQMYRKITDDMAFTLSREGAIRDTAPYYLGNSVADPVSVSFLLIGKFSYDYYGDRSVIEKHYSNYRKWVEYLTSNTVDGVLSLGIYGDWCPAISVIPTNDTRFNKGLPISVISTMYLKWYYDLMHEYASILGNTEDEEKYERLSKQTKNIINENFFNPNKACYCENIQAGNAIALSLDITEAGNREQVLQAIIDDIEKRDYHMTCGNQSYRHLIGVLADAGRNDIVVQLLRQKDYPSIGYMLVNGATTIWERWECEISATEPNMHSYCHPMFGSYDYWFYNYLSGIHIKASETYAFKIMPCFVDGIDCVNTAIETVYGNVGIEYTCHEGYVDVNVEIPSNTKAELVLNGKPIMIGSGKHFFSNVSIK